MVRLCATLLVMITIGTEASGYAAELGQECKYSRTIEVDRYGNTVGNQTYHCKTAPREIITKTEYKEVGTCGKKLLFGWDCDEFQPEGDDLSAVLTTIYSMGFLQ